jgi:hypothetical protein
MGSWRSALRVFEKIGGIWNGAEGRPFDKLRAIPSAVEG